MSIHMYRHATQGTYQISATQCQLYPAREIVRTVIVGKEDLVNTATTSSKRERSLKRYCVWQHYSSMATKCNLVALERVAKPKLNLPNVYVCVSERHTN